MAVSVDIWRFRNGNAEVIAEGVTPDYTDPDAQDGDWYTAVPTGADSVVEYVVGDVFASSLQGVDGGAGTRAEPVGSLDELAQLVSGGDLVRVERGSTFSSQAVLGGFDNVKFQPYGTGDLPFIDCSEELPDGDWSITSGQSNTYEQSVSPSTAGVPSVSARVFEDGEELQIQSSISDVEANPGSFYADQSSAPYVLYVHPTGSTTPSSDGKLYEWTKRSGAVIFRAFNELSPATIRGLVARRPLSESGTHQVPAGGTIQECLSIDGGKHHFIHGGGEIIDSISFGEPTRDAKISLVWFHGNGTPSFRPIEAYHENYMAIKTGGAGTFSTVAHKGFDPATVRGMVQYECVSPQTNSTDDFRGVYAYSSTIGRLNKQATIQESIYDNIGVTGINGGRPRGNDVTYKNCVISDTLARKKTFSSSATTTFEKCVLISTSDLIFDDISSNGTSIELNNCLVINLRSNLRIFADSGPLVGDNCIFMAASPNVEVQLDSNAGQALSTLQADTGAFGNSVFATHDQYRSLMQGSIREGDMRINGSADVTAADGTVYSGQLPDGTPLTDVGIQRRWDYQQRQAVPGAPSQWPTPPTSLQECKTYVSDPSAHEWRGPELITHKNEVSLGDRLAAFWKMNGGSGEDELDEIGSNTLVQTGGVGSGSNSDFPFRTFDNTQRLEIGSPDAALKRNRPLWVAAPVRPDDLSAPFSYIIKWFNNGDGYQVRQELDGQDLFVQLGGAELKKYFSVAQGQFAIVQIWTNPVLGEGGVRLGGVESISDRTFHARFQDPDATSFYVGGDGRSYRSFIGAIGPLMVANAYPTKADRDWLYNGGSYRTLSEIQNRTVTVKEI